MLSLGALQTSDKVYGYTSRGISQKKVGNRNFWGEIAPGGGVSGSGGQAGSISLLFAVSRTSTVTQETPFPQGKVSPRTNSGKGDKPPPRRDFRFGKPSSTGRSDRGSLAVRWPEEFDRVAAYAITHGPSEQTCGPSAPKHVYMKGLMPCSDAQ